VVCDGDDTTLVPMQVVVIRDASRTGVIVCDLSTAITKTLEAFTLVIPRVVISHFSQGTLFNSLTTQQNALAYKSISSWFCTYSLFYIFKKPFFYFNYPLLQNTSHLILYFTIHNIKIIL
jgi:hypothetical protein